MSTQTNRIIKSDSNDYVALLFKDENMTQNSVLALSILLFIFSSCSSGQSRFATQTPEQRRAELFYNEGTRQLGEGQYTEALRNLLEAYKLRPQDTKTLNNLAMAYYFRGRVDLAQEHLKKAVRADANNTDARINLAAIYLQQGKHQEAIRQYHEILEDLTYSHHYRTHFNLALAYEGLNSIANTIDQLEKSLEVRQDYCPANYKMGEIYFQQRRFERAEDYFRKASIGTCHGNPAPLYNRALSFLKLQNYERAQGLFEDVIELHPTSQFADMAGQKLGEISAIPSEGNQLRQQIRAQRTREHILQGHGHQEIKEILPDLFEGPSF